MLSYILTSWCGPCRLLKPKLIDAWHKQKNFKLIKINSDENEELSQQLNITALPTVFLVYKGNVIKTFTGLPHDSKLAEFFDEINLMSGLSSNEKVFQSLLLGAEEFFKKSEYEQALNMLSEAVSQKGFIDKYEHIVHISSAVCHFHLKKFKEAREIIDKIKLKRAKEIDGNEVLRKKVALLEVKLMMEENPELKRKERSSLEKAIEQNPADLSARYNLAVKLVEEEEFSAACKQLIEIVAIDRNWENQKANNLLKSIFNTLGSGDQLVKEARATLQKILY